MKIKAGMAVVGLAAALAGATHAQQEQQQSATGTTAGQARGAMGAYGPGGMGRQGAGPMGHAPGAMSGYGPGAMMGQGPGMMGGYGPGAMGYGPGMMMGGYGMGGMMGYGPAMMGVYGSGGPLDTLNLSEEQRDKVVRIQEDMRAKNWSTMGEMRAETFKMHLMYRADPVDANALLEQQRKVDELRRQMLRTHVEARNQVAAVLTPEQRQRFRSFGPWWQGAVE